MLLDTGKHKDGFADVGGLRLHYVERGAPGAPPLVLLHGLQDCAGSWDRFAAALSADYRVIALDQRGHGDSEWAPPDSYQLSDFVSDVEALVEKMGLDAFVLLGHGAGGRTGTAYTARHPEKVEALVVVDGDLSETDDGSVRMGERSASGPDEELASLEAVVEHLRLRQPGSTDDALARQALRLTRELDGGRRAWKRDPAVVEASQQADLWAEWRRLRCPKLVARGRQSHVLAHEDAVKMREATNRVRLAELEGGGHWFHQELPGAFEATVRWFLQDPPE